MSQVVVSTGNKRKFDAKAYWTSKKAKTAKKRLRVLSNKYHSFVRSCSFLSAYKVGLDATSGNGFNINGVSSGSFNMQFAFTLSGVQVYIAGVLSTTLAMPSYTEFTSLYDQYRINYVDCEFMFSNNNSSVNSPSTCLPVMYMVKDYDDSNQAFVSDLQQYSTQQTWQLGNQHGKDGIKRIRIKPNVDVAVYNTALTTGYARGKPQFIDTGSPAVPHYGIKIAYDPINYTAASTILGYMTCVFRYHLTMQNSK